MYLSFIVIVNQNICSFNVAMDNLWVACKYESSNNMMDNVRVTKFGKLNKALERMPRSKIFMSETNKIYSKMKHLQSSCK
jgi:hypothetical protein